MKRRKALGQKRMQPTDKQVKRIAVLLPSLQIGGAEKMVLEELKVLKDDPMFAVEVHLVFEKGPLFEEIASIGVPAYVWDAPHGSFRMLKTFADIIRHLRRTDCDILHSHLLDGIGPVIGRLGGAKVVATVHNDKGYGVADRFGLAKSDLVLACGQQVRRNICRFIPHEKVGLLRNAIQRPDMVHADRSDVLKKLGIQENSRLVVSLGRLTRQKGYDLLIEAFSSVSAVLQDAVLIIGGEGEERGLLINMIGSAGLGEKVLLPGMISDVHELLAACDLYVNASRWEGLPMTLIEAIAHGKPVVAADVGGNSEAVRDGITGILVQPEDPGSLAGAMIRMLKDDNFRAAAGRAAVTLFNDEYTIDRHCERLSGCYMQLLH